MKKERKQRKLQNEIRTNKNSKFNEGISTHKYFYNYECRHKTTMWSRIRKKVDARAKERIKLTCKPRKKGN